MKKILVLFDFDGTLIKEDSFWLFMKYTRTGWRHIFFTLLKHFPEWMIRGMKFGYRQALKEKLLLAFLRDAHAEETGASFAGYLHEGDFYQKKVYALFEQYVQNQDDYEVRVVSASPDIWIAQWSHDRGVKSICTRCEIREGKYSGRFIGKNCNRKEKGKRCDDTINYENYRMIIAFGNHIRDDAALFERSKVAYLVKNGLIYKVKDESKKESNM